LTVATRLALAFLSLAAGAAAAIVVILLAENVLG
jgi:hypothetical protein